MDAHKALITNIFNNSTLVEVPFFQRSYVAIIFLPAKQLLMGSSDLLPF